MAVSSILQRCNFQSTYKEKENFQINDIRFFERHRCRYCCIVFYSLDTSSDQEFRLKNANSSVIQLISVEQALTELQKIDDYISNFSRFDLESRLNSSSAIVDDYYAFLAWHILSWNEEYSECIGIFIDYINTICIDQLQLLTLPSGILIVLTDGRDENNAAYCRKKNVIVLPRNRVQMHERNRQVFIHELFRIWSKQGYQHGDS